MERRSGSRGPRCCTSAGGRGLVGSGIHAARPEETDRRSQYQPSRTSCQTSWRRYLSCQRTWSIAGAVLCGPPRINTRSVFVARPRFDPQILLTLCCVGRRSTAVPNTWRDGGRQLSSTSRAKLSWPPRSWSLAQAIRHCVQHLAFPVRYCVRPQKSAMWRVEEMPTSRRRSRRAGRGRSPRQAGRGPPPRHPPPTPRSTRSDDRSNTTPWAIEAAKVSRCIGYGGACWRWPARASHSRTFSRPAFSRSPSSLTSAAMPMSGSSRC